MRRRHSPVFNPCRVVAGAALLASLLAGSAFAQTAPRSVTPVPQPAAPRAAQPGQGITAAPGAPVTVPGAPSPAGLASPSPFPQGLPSPQPFPQGVPSAVIQPPGTAAPGTAVVPGTAPGAVTDGTQVIQPGGVASTGTPASAQNVPAGSSGYTALQLAQSFRLADANLNGELTRAEAQRLSIMPSSFDEMDRNKDGILSRSEYEDGVR